MPVIKPKVRGFVCITAHPKGCAAHVDEQINFVQRQPAIKNGPKKVLIIGASTGYGLASRIAGAFGCQADTFGVFYERPSAKNKPASAGWYNAIAFEQKAQKAGLYAQSLNGDAFSQEMKEQTVDALKKGMGPVDLVVYSLAAPRRIDPKTGVTYKSTLKPIGQSFTGKTLDTDKKIITDVALEPATEEEIEGTIKVMGGEDWELWMEALEKAGLLAPGCKTVAYSYIGPEVTWPIYKNGTIGQAKAHLEASCKRINEKLEATLSGQAFVSINKALVTQASSAIPVVPLYISILYKIMRNKGTHEGCIEQMYRLFTERLYSEAPLPLDPQGRIRIDDWEMASDVQEEIKRIWPQVNTQNLSEFADFSLYQKDFLKLFGFGLDGVDYEEDVALDLQFPMFTATCAQ